MRECCCEIVDWQIGEKEEAEKEQQGEAQQGADGEREMHQTWDASGRGHGQCRSSRRTTWSERECFSFGRCWGPYSARRGEFTCREKCIEKFAYFLQPEYFGILGFINYQASG